MSPLPLPVPLSLPPIPSQSWGETRQSLRGPPSPGRSHRRIKGAGRPPAVRSPGSERLAPPPAGGCPRLLSPPPAILELRRRQPTAPYLASITHLHTGASERASERERARGREEGRREEGGRGGERGEEEEERAEYTADIISTTVAEPYRTCFTAGGFKTSPVEQQPELQQPQDTVSLPLPPLPHATPDPFTLYSKWRFFFSSDSVSPPPPSPSPLI